MRLYTVYDKVAQEGSQPFMAKNDGIALRSYRKLLTQVDPSLQKEYQLLYIGDFHPEAAFVEGLDSHIEVVDTLEDEDDV